MIGPSPSEGRAAKPYSAAALSGLPRDLASRVDDYLYRMVLYVATTEFPAEPRWDPYDGFRNTSTFLDGVAASPDVAKAFAARCSEVPTRWFTSGRRKGLWIGAHRNWDGDGWHFHRVERTRVANGVDDSSGFPTVDGDLVTE